MKFLAIFVLLFFISSSANAARKCCHGHGGIVKCRGESQHLCRDGYVGNCPKHNH